MKAVSFKIIGITDVTIRNILQNASCEALGLYVSYFEIAKWQETYRVKATTGFMQKRIGWGRDKLIKHKKELVNLGLVVDYTSVGDDGKVKGHFIEIKHLVDDNHPTEKPDCGLFHPVVKSDTSAINNSISAINKKESAKSASPEEKIAMDKLFNFWNDSKGLVSHSIFSQPMKDIVLKRLRQGYEDKGIAQTILRYETILTGEGFWLTKRWTFLEFMKQENAMPKMHDLKVSDYKLTKDKKYE
jgi:hypothetical protein